ncbi:MAG: D-alanyl-D-alanine carboxypeptidase [Chloroflexi bacterium]|nr:D-alanyl-D-alanine carboxypeptidase [Chloroflexota bacterium]
MYVRGVSKQIPLHRLAARAWEAMVAAARRAGLNDPLLLPTSGYRSSQHQRELWEAALKRYGSAEVARKWVAPPGSSAHQSGRAMDLYLGSKNDSSNVDNLRRLPAYQWMVANAERFGFYPYGNEPWHWEYNPPVPAGSAPPPFSTSPNLPGSATPGSPVPPTPTSGTTTPKALPAAFETPISCEDSPYAWAREVRRKMQTWWSDQDLRRVNGRWQAVANVPVGSALRQMAPQAFPGTPPQVFMGFCANGSVRGNTTECASETCRKQAFHEIGLFGTEAGLRSRPAPDPNPGGEYNSWGRLAGTDLVRRLLGGRSATMQPDAWKTAIPDQVAVGLANLLDHGRNVSALLDPSIRSSGPGSLWFVALCFMGWSAGDGRTAKKHINPLSSALAAVPESRRWGEFLRLAADGIRSGRLDLRGKRKHNSIAWSALRTWQKLAAGQLLASQTGGNLAWFDPGLGSAEGDIARVITCAARSAG